MRRTKFSALIIALAAMLIFTMPALAITPTIKLMRITNNGDTPLDYGSYLTAFPTQALVDSGKLGADGLDARLTSVGGGDPLPMMLTNTKVLTVASLTSYGTASLYFTTNHDAASAMPIIVGNLGYFTTLDNPDIELGNNFTLTITGLFDTSFQTSIHDYIMDKDKAFRIYVYDDQTIRAAILDSSGAEVCTATISGVDTNEHTLVVSGDTANLSIAVDGGTPIVSAEPIGVGVPANSDPITWDTHNVMPYILNITLSVAGHGDPTRIHSTFYSMVYSGGYIYTIETENDSPWDSRLDKIDVSTGLVVNTVALPTADNAYWSRCFVTGGNIFVVGDSTTGLLIQKRLISDLGLVASNHYDGGYISGDAASISSDGSQIFQPFSYVRTGAAASLNMIEFSTDNLGYTAVTGVISTDGRILDSVAENAYVYVLFLYDPANEAHLVKINHDTLNIAANWTLPHNSANHLIQDASYVYSDTGGNLIVRTSKASGTSTDAATTSPVQSSVMFVVGTNLYIAHFSGHALLEKENLTDWNGATTILTSSLDDAVYSIAYDGSNTLFVGASNPDPDTGQYSRGNNIYIVSLSGSWGSSVTSSEGSSLSSWGGHRNIAVDSAGKIWAAAEGPTSRNVTVRYSTNGGSTWTTSTTLDVNGDSTPNPCLAVDSSNNVHVLYGAKISGSNYELEYVKWNGSTWSSPSRIDYGPDNLFYRSEADMAIDSNDKVHIVWRDSAALNEQIHYANNVSGSWGYVTLAGSGATCQNPIIAIGPDNIPVVIFTRLDVLLYTKATSNNGSSWGSTLTVSNQADGSYFGGSIYNSMVIDSTGTARIAWTDLDSGGTTFQAAYNTVTSTGVVGTTFMIYTTNSGSYAYPSLSIDRSGQMWVFMQYPSDYAGDTGRNAWITYSGGVWSNPVDIGGDQTGFYEGDLASAWSYYPIIGGVHTNVAAQGFIAITEDGVINGTEFASLSPPTIPVMHPISSGGVAEALKYEPNSIIQGNVLPDRDATQDATIHWGVNDPNTAFSEFVTPSAPAVATPGSPGAGPGIGGGTQPITKVQTGTWTLPSLNPPLIGDLINNLLDSTVFGRAFFWYPVALLILLLAKFWAYRLTFSLFMKMLSGLVAVIALCAISLLPWLSLPLFFIWDFTIMTHSQRGAL